MKPRVFLINNYSMERAYSLWEKGLSGSHHVWGKVELDKSGKVDMTVFPHEKYKFFNKIGKFFGIGHLDQQIRILFNLRHFDILYSPYSKSNTKLLLFLKVLGLFRKPIVVTIHQPFWFGKNDSRLVRLYSRLYILNYSASIFLSEPLLEKSIRLLKIPEKAYKNKFSLSQWGPDMSYYERYCLKRKSFEECDIFISAGHTDRDFETLIEAFRGLDYKLKIFCTPTSIPNTVDIPPNVEVNWEVTLSYDLIPYYQQSIAILIPLKYPLYKEGCQGMTSLQDVVSFGKPLIMTRNPCLNLDVEKEGIGYCVDMYDVKGWKEKLKLLKENKDIWLEMSNNSQLTFKEKFNSKIFASHLEDVLLSVYKGKRD
jgi:glycosyltransferase involved in cell wall biosynthesis